MMARLPLLPLLLIGSRMLAQADGIYVSDAGNFSNPPWQILRYELDGTDPFAYITEELNWPQDILFLDDIGQVLISNLGSGTIDRYDAATGAHIGSFATGIGGPTRMKLGPDGLLYVLQWTGNGKVRRYGTDGTYLGEFTSVGVPQSIGLDWDASGNLYVSSYSGDLVRRFDSEGADLGLFITSDLVGPTNIRFDQNGDLLVADYDGGAVKRFDPNGAYMGPFITGLSQVEGVALYPDGRFLLGNGGTHSVKRFHADGTYIDDLVPSGSGGLLNPNAIVLRGAGTIGLAETTRAGTCLHVYPSAGRMFRVHVDHPEAVRSIRVHAMSGEVVAMPLPGNWDASGMAPGLYLFSVEWQDGTSASQRIEVIDP